MQSSEIPGESRRREPAAAVSAENGEDQLPYDAIVDAAIRTLDLLSVHRSAVPWCRGTPRALHSYALLRMIADLMNGAARRRAIRRTLTAGMVSSQAELVHLLKERGFDVTQATVSRDLKALGAEKVRDDDGRLSYALKAGTADSSLARTLAEFAGEFQPSGNLVVITTPPGAAQVVAGAIDRAALDDVVGTVAGDDTVLVVTTDGRGARVAERLEEIGAG
jgi:transcriptional regulator of arginine metabolism